LRPIFCILDTNETLDLFENVSVLGYADDLKFDLITVECKSIEFTYLIHGMALERVNEIKVHGVIMDGKMSSLPHMKANVSKSSRMLGLIKLVSREYHDPYTHKTLYTSFNT
jgi:hypothetical protein